MATYEVMVIGIETRTATDHVGNIEKEGCCDGIAFGPIIKLKLMQGTKCTCCAADYDIARDALEGDAEKAWGSIFIRAAGKAVFDGNWPHLRAKQKIAIATATACAARMDMA